MKINVLSTAPKCVCALRELSWGTGPLTSLYLYLLPFQATRTQPPARERKSGALRLRPLSQKRFNRASVFPSQCLRVPLLSRLPWQQSTMTTDQRVRHGQTLEYGSRQEVSLQIGHCHSTATKHSFSLRVYTKLGMLWGPITSNSKCHT